MLTLASELNAHNQHLFQTKVELGSDFMSLSYDGKVGFTPQRQADGAYRLQIASLQKLIASLGLAQLLETPIDNVDIAGHVKTTGKDLNPPGKRQSASD